MLRMTSTAVPGDESPQAGDETKGALKSAGNIVVKPHYVKNVRLDHEPNRNALTLPNHGAIPEKALKSAAPSPNKVRTPRDPMFM
jgi:hypothetical protein